MPFLSPRMRKGKQRRKREKEIAERNVSRLKKAANTDHVLSGAILPPSSKKSAKMYLDATDNKTNFNSL